MAIFVAILFAAVNLWILFRELWRMRKVEAGER
jgi:hypothetical protein